MGPTRKDSKSFLILVFLVGIPSLTGLRAQVLSDRSLSIQQGTSEAGPPTSTEELGRYSPSLNGGLVIDLLGGPRFRWLFGGSLTGAYDDFTRVGQFHTQSGVSLLDPELGITGHGHRFRYIFQYDPTLPIYYKQRFWPTQPFHSASLSSAVDLAPRLNLSFAASGRYGDETLRQLTSLGFEAVGTIPVAGSDSALVALDRGKVLGSDGHLSLDWHQSLRNRLTLSIGHSYYELQALTNQAPRPTSHTNDSSAALTFGRGINKRTTVQAFGLAKRIHDPIPCWSYGGGLGGSFTPTAFSKILVSAGPQASSALCGRSKTVFVHALWAAWLDPATRVYVGINRDLVIAYRLRGRWEDSAVLGLSRRLTSTTSAGAYGGFVRGDRLAALTPDLGYFLAPYLRRELSGNLALIVTYRRFFWRNDVGVLHRNLELLRLEWSPPAEGSTKF
jgi:hypothetical protein